MIDERLWADAYLTGYGRNAQGMTLGVAPWHWCTYCGKRWVGSCRCVSRCLIPFPDQAAVRSAYMLGGREAIITIESGLYLDRVAGRYLRNIRW